MQRREVEEELVVMDMKNRVTGQTWRKAKGQWAPRRRNRLDLAVQTRML